MNRDQEKLIFLKENKDIIDNICNNYFKKTSKFIKKFSIKSMLYYSIYASIFLFFNYISISVLLLIIVFKLYLSKKYPRDYIIDVKNTELYFGFDYKFMHDLNKDYVNSLSKEELNILKKMQKYDLNINVDIFNKPLTSYTEHLLYKILKLDNNLIANELSLFNELNQIIIKKKSEKEYKENIDIINQIILNQKLVSKEISIIENNNEKENINLNSLILNQIKF